MDDIRKDKVIRTRLRIIYLLSFIFSLVGAILLFAEDFLEWYTDNPFPELDEYGYIHLDDEVYGGLILMLALFLIVCMIISILGIYNPKFMNIGILALGEIFAIIVFLMAIIGIAIAAGDLEDKSSWNPDAGFYGALLGGLLTCIFFSISIWGSIKIKKHKPIQKVAPERIAPKGVVSEMSYCTYCGKPVSGLFCTYCGSDLRKIQEDIAVPEIKHCPKCDKPASGQFCTYCGTKMF